MGRGETGRAGAQRLGVISRGCLAGSEAGAAGSLRLRGGEAPARLAVPWAPVCPAPRPPLLLGGLCSQPQRRDARAASADPLRPPAPNSSLTVSQASPTDTPWSKHRQGSPGTSGFRERLQSVSSAPPTPQPVSQRAEPGLPQHKADGRLGHGAGEPRSLQGVSGRTCSACGALLCPAPGGSHATFAPLTVIPPGGLPQAGLTALDLDLRELGLRECLGLQRA